MAHLSPMLEAKLLAADAVEWLDSIRKAADRNTLEHEAKTSLGRLKSRFACEQIIAHFKAAIAEERLKFSIYDKRTSGKDLAAGDRE